MDEDEIHFLRSSQDPLKSEPLRSTMKNTAFAENSHAFVRKFQNVRLRLFTCGSKQPQRDASRKQKRKDGVLATVSERRWVT